MGTLVAGVVEVAELGLVPQQTSEIASEVELAPEAELNVVITFAAAFKSFNQSLTPEVRAAAAKLKEAFGVRQGCFGRTLMVEGREMEWKSFVDRYFGITPRRFNQILEIADDEVVKIAPKPRGSGSGSRSSEEPGLRDQLDQLDEEVARLRAQLDDPVKLCVARWQERDPEDIQADLNRIIGDLNLGDCLKVELYEVY
jgi:hypothetical protein